MSGRLHMERDWSHLLIYAGPLTFQWEYGAYVNVNLYLSERHDWHLTYSTRAWREASIHQMMRQEPPTRLSLTNHGSQQP